MSIVFSYTVLIEYNTGVSRNSQTPQDNVVVLGSSPVFLEANSASSSQKRVEYKSQREWTRRESNAGIFGASEVFYH